MIAELEEELEKLKEQQKELYETSVFLIKMLTAGVFFHIILTIYPDTAGLQAGLAEITQRILSLIGVNLERQGIRLIDSNVTYIVTQDCLGWKSMAAFSSLVFSSTSRYRKHFKTIIIGLLAIVAVNIFRIVTTIYLSHVNIISFDIIHSLFWKWGLTFFVILLWAVWIHQKSGK
jgi:exosortase/archaeosortase family protein